MRPRFTGLPRLLAIFLPISLVLLLSACGGEPIGTPTGQTTATSTPYGTAGTPYASGTPSAPLVTKIISAVTCRSVDSNLNAVDPTSTFGPSETVYLAVGLQNFPHGTRATAKWYFGSQFLNTYTITAKRDYVTTVVSFNLKSTPPFAVGSYHVDIYLDDYLSETVHFAVSAKPPTPIPSASATPGGTPSVTGTPTTAEGGTVSPTPSEPATGTPTPEQAAVPSPSPSASETATPAPSPTPSASETPTPTPSPTPGGPATFSSQNLHLSLTYPHGWTVSDNGSSVGFFSPEPNVQMFVSSQQAGPTDTVEGLNGALIAAAKGAHPDLTVQGNQSVSFAGETWLETSFSFTDDKGVAQSTVDWVALRNGSAYFIVANAPQAVFDQQRGAFQSLRDSFKFTS